jgi:probable phosphoglycerate mutase
LKEIYLVRHGQVTSPGILVGQKDWPLTPEGRAEIEGLKAKLNGLTFDLAFVSPLIRTRETLAILLGDLKTPVKVEPRLKEITLGQWDGLNREDIKKRWPLHWAYRGQNFVERRAPGGESFRELAARVWPAFDQIKKACFTRALVVAHQAVNRVILAREWNQPLETLLEIPQPTGALTIIPVPEKNG